MAEASGYDAVFLTDHDRIWGRRDLAMLNETSDRVRLFPGIERTLYDGSHLLVLGADQAVYEDLTMPDEVLAQACSDGCLTVLAHPFRYVDELPAYAGSIDALEVRTCNHSLPEHIEAARSYARAHNMAEVYSSDAHGLNFMNRFWIETETSFDTPQQFRRLIVAGQYRNVMREVRTALPPAFKAKTLNELSEEDLGALVFQPCS